MPKVFVSQQPAELILLTGEPSYLLVQGTGLLWVSNTESDVFRMGKTGPVYYLVAGRWFSAPDFSGTVDVCHAVAAGGLQEDPARARPLARAGVGSGNRPGRRSRAPGADTADRARQQEGD